MKKNTLILTIGMTLLFGCSQKQHTAPQIISVDIDNAEPLCLTADKDVNYISLESSTPAFSRDIKNVFYINDTIIRYGQNKVSAFDRQGNYLFDYSGVGEGPEEFIRLSSLFIQGDTLNMYDGSTRRILRYSVAGNFIEYNTCKKNDKGISPANLIPFPGTHNYFVLPIFIGMPDVENPRFSLYDETLNAIKFSTDLKTHSFMNAYFPLVQTDSGILYSDAYSYDIYYVDEELIPTLKYSVDYGKYAISKSLQEKGAAEISKALANQDEDLKYKSIGIKYLNNTPDHLIFGCSGKGLYIVSFDKNTGKTKVFSPNIDPELRWGGFISVQGDLVTIAAESKEDYDQNFTLITFPLNKLM